MELTIWGCGAAIIGALLGMFVTVCLRDNWDILFMDKKDRKRKHKLAKMKAANQSCSNCGNSVIYKDSVKNIIKCSQDWSAIEGKCLSSAWLTVGEDNCHWTPQKIIPQEEDDAPHIDRADRWPI